MRKPSAKVRRMRKMYYTIESMGKPPTSEPERQLDTWQEIASYLGVSVRAAQYFEQQAHLPIRRRLGQKGRVFAYVSELDAWKTELSIADGAATPSDLVVAPKEFLPVPLSASVKDAVVSVRVEGHRDQIRVIWHRSRIFVLPILLGWLFYSLYSVLFVPHGPPTDFRVEGKNLIALNAKSQELWRYNFKIPLKESYYSQEASLSHAWLGDLDGDGRTELIFIAVPVNQGDVGSTIICFAADGRPRWRFTPGQPVTDAGGDHMLPPYFPSGLQVIPGKVPSDARIIVSSNHYLSQPNQVAILDVHGNVVGQYWHPGHLLYMGQADLDGDGRNELLLAGVNNGNHQATLVVLDPWKIIGLMTPTEMQDQRFRLLDMLPAKEKAVVFFPRSCISRGQPYTRVAGLHITRDRLVVDVSEGTVERDSPGFVYELDYALNVVNLVPNGVGVMRIHQELESKHILDHPFSQEDWGRLKTLVVVKRF
jgi:hypothetical protein